MSEEERDDVCVNMSSLMQDNQEEDFLVRLLVSVSQHEHTQMEMPEMLEEGRDGANMSSLMQDNHGR